jgi:hypothetical protein
VARFWPCASTPTEKGFAVSYDLFDPDIRRLVDDVAALVPSRRTG